MSLLSLHFILFIIVFQLIFFTVSVFKKSSSTIQKVLLLCANIYFYTWFGIGALIVICAMILVSYLMYNLIRKNKSKGNLILGIFVSLVPLFATRAVQNILEALIDISENEEIVFSEPIKSIIAPIGISFFTLKIISFLVDSYKGSISEKVSMFDYAIYVSFFPTIISGPIDRPNPFLSQLNKVKSFNSEIWIRGLLISLSGYIEKMIIADRLGVIVNYVFGNHAGYKGLPLFLTSILYSLQIYLDFSGYTLIVCGVAYSMGFICNKNFLQPYFSRNTREFWHRWHVSFSEWLRDYIYIPLGGSREGNSKRLRNIIITFLVSGLWHGLGLNYIFWGFLHGIYQVIGIVTEKAREKAYRKIKVFDTGIHRFMQIIVTFMLVNFAWVFFWCSKSLFQGFEIISEMFDGGLVYFNWIFDSGITGTEVKIMIAAGILVFIIDYLRYKKVDVLKKYFSLNVVCRFIIVYILFVAIILFGFTSDSFDMKDFIYFNF